MSKWYQDKNGDDSSLRMLAIPAGWLGMAVVFAGAVGAFVKMSDAIALCGIGSGLITVALGAKAWQKGKE